jgi:transposase
LAEPAQARLRALVGYRDDLVARRTRLRNQRHAAEWAGEPSVVAWLEADLAAVAARLTELEAAIRAVLATVPEAPTLTAAIGVGAMTAAAVMAYLPAGVLGNPKAAAAYAGVHPRQTQSGQRATSRLSKQGCPALRRYLYLAALTAIRHDPAIRAWHDHLRARGKPVKAAICAVMHKLLRQMMGRLRTQRDPAPLAWSAAA